MRRSGSLYITGSQAGSTNVHLLGCTVNFNRNTLNIGLPHMIASSMRMAHTNTEMSTLFANSTFSHDCTSFISLVLHKSQACNIRYIIRLSLAMQVFFHTFTRLKICVKIKNLPARHFHPLPSLPPDHCSLPVSPKGNLPHPVQDRLP